MKEDEIDALIRVLLLPAQYNIELNLSNLKIKVLNFSVENTANVYGETFEKLPTIIPMKKYEVQWSEKEYPTRFMIETFTKIIDAVEFFVNKRHELKLGADYEI